MKAPGVGAHELNPFPALAAQPVQDRRRLLQHQPVEQGGIEQGSVVAKQVDINSATFGAVGVHADAEHAGVIDADRSLQHRAADVVGAHHVVILVHAGEVQRAEVFILPGVILGGGESLHLLDAEMSIPKRLHQLGGDMGEAEASLDNDGREAEGRSDVLVALALVAQLLESIELVGGVHRCTDNVFGGRDRYGVLCFVTDDDRDGMVGGQFTGGNQGGEGGETALPGNDGKAAFVFPLGDGQNRERLDHAGGADRGFQPIEIGQRIGDAHVVGRRHKVGDRHERNSSRLCHNRVPL